MSGFSSTWRRLLAAARTLSFHPGADNDSAAACAVARRLGPDALCRRTDFYGWAHLANVRGGAILVAAPDGLGEFALMLAGFYHGRIEMAGPAPEHLFIEPAEGFGVRPADQDPAAILRSGGYLGALFRPHDSTLFELAKECQVPILPLRATRDQKRFRLDIQPPIQATLDTFDSRFPLDDK